MKHIQYEYSAMLRDSKRTPVCPEAYSGVCGVEAVSVISGESEESSEQPRLQTMALLGAYSKIIVVHFSGRARTTKAQL